jgi:hypothetical protein
METFYGTITFEYGEDQVVGQKVKRRRWETRKIGKTDLFYSLIGSICLFGFLSAG